MPRLTLIVPLVASIACGATLLGTLGCNDQKVADRGFSTSGDPAADQRADQRMARDQQLKGNDPGSAGDDKGKPATSGAQTIAQKTLFDRLGGQAGLNALVDDFLNRVIQDPTVNWTRKGVEQGGFSIHRNKTVEWPADQAHRDALKQHLVQFLQNKTGGPIVTYEGKEMKAVHADLHITTAEFNAAIGDMKQSLDKLQIATPEQKELLQIVEATREQVVTEK